MQNGTNCDSSSFEVKIFLTEIGTFRSFISTIFLRVGARTAVKRRTEQFTG